VGFYKTGVVYEGVHDMSTMHIGKRKSGISLVGDLPWGSHFCQFYRTKTDLLDILVPYFKAGLQNNEFCVWVTFKPIGAEDAKKALRKAVPRFEQYEKKGQIELISSDRWYSRGGKSGRAIISRLDKAVLRGFDGLRLACNAFPEKKGAPLKKDSKSTYTAVKKRSSLTGFISYGTDVISRYNAIAVFVYPREKFDAPGLMDVVKRHRFALLRNAGRWEIIESSEARIAKDALKRSEERLQSLFNNMSEGIAYHRIMLDAKGKPRDYIFLEVNKAFETLTGLKGKNITGRRVTEVLPGIEKDPTDWIRRYGRVSLTGKPVRFESYSEALKKWFSVSAFSPHKGYFAVTFKDITERKRAEQALLESERRLARSQEIAHLGSWELDMIKDRLTWSDEVYRIFGLQPQEFGATYGAFLERVHPDDRATVDAAYSGSVREGKDSYEIEHRVVRKDTGEIRWVHEKCQHVRDTTGKIISSFGMVHDITERKKAEEEISKLNKELRDKVLQLEAVNTELDAFSYSVSHDLRAPLRSIDGFSLAVLEDYGDKLDAEGRDYLERVRSATQRMGDLIDDLLKLSVVSRAGMVHERVNLSNIAGKIAGQLRLSQPERQAEFVLAGDLAATGDSRLLGIAIENLLDNAWKFTGKREKAVIEFGTTQMRSAECGMRNENNSEIINPKSEIVYFVRDNGIGFDMAYADKLFQPFQRLHTVKEFPGTGIGLATVRRIIERHGGRIWIQGRSGEGTTVYFTLK